MFRIILTTCVLAFSIHASCSAAPQPETQGIGAPTIKHDEMLGLGGNHAGLGLVTQAEAAVNSRRYDRAIELAERALAKDNGNIDGHMVYARALEGKLGQQTIQNPELLRKCVAEWLAVMRNQYGEEKGLNLFGAGGSDILWKDDEHYVLARQSIRELTGTTPKAWETNNRFLNRAMKARKSVLGEVVAIPAKAK